MSGTEIAKKIQPEERWENQGSKERQNEKKPWLTHENGKEIYSLE